MEQQWDHNGTKGNKYLHGGSWLIYEYYSQSYVWYGYPPMGLVHNMSFRIIKIK